MNSLKKYEAPLTLAAMVISLISAVLHLISMLVFCDVWGYYTAGAVLPVISNIFMLISVVAFAICAFLLTDRERKIDAPNGIAKYAALLPAAALIFHVVKLVMDGLSGANIALLISAAISAVFFIMIAFSKEYDTLTAVCGVGFVIWLAISWFNSYNDLFIPMNSPEKIFFHFGCVSAALLTVGELRSMYDISAPRFYRFSLWSSLVLLSSASLPSVWELIFKDSQSSVYSECLVLFALFVYAVVRCVSLTFSPAHHTEETPTIEE